jgi:transglutaminase-like putative cysteine protease
VAHRSPRRRRWVVAAIAVAVAAVLGLAAAYLTGYVTFGNPLSGTWKPVGGGDEPTLAIMRTTDSYGWALVFQKTANGSEKTSTGWFHATRSRNVPTSATRLLDNGEFTGVVLRNRLVFHPWNGHLVLFDSGTQFELSKVNGSTWAPSPQSSP